MTKRRHKVFVRDVGPAFSYATEERAHAKARALVAGEHVEVLVWGPILTRDDLPMRRTVYRHDAPPRREVHDNERGWIRDEGDE